MSPPRLSAPREETPLSGDYDDGTLDALFSQVLQNHGELVAIGLGTPLRNRDPAWG
jgi:hypothetical protein